MEMDINHQLGLTLERLAAAAGLLEQTLDKLAQHQSAFADEAAIGRIVATVDSRRDSDLEQKLAAAEQRCAAAEQKIAELQAQATAAAPGRKTLPITAGTLVAKPGASVDGIDAGALDAALGSLSLEQRIAVKSQLIRAGLMG